MHASLGRIRRGFTLVEMLVVIAIIAILAGLITAAAAKALYYAKQTKIKTEVDIIAGAFEKFKQQYGQYPPANMSCTGGVANPQLVSFVSRAFPRYAGVGGNSLQQQIYVDLTNAGFNLNQSYYLNPQTALVFWLSGFGPDPTDPFNRQNLQITRTPFFTFDQTRLVVAESYGNNVPIGNAGAVSATGTVCPVNTPYGTAPSVYTYATTPNTLATYGLGQLVYNAPYGNAAYCYFDYQSYGPQGPYSATFYLGQPASNGQVGILSAGLAGTTNLEYLTPSMQTGAAPAPVPIVSTGTGFVMPYVLDVNNNNQFDFADTFCKPTSFQIISAGQDGAFGASFAPALQTTVYGRLYPGGINSVLTHTYGGTGISYDPPPPNGGSADDDNITNFCEQSSLASAKP